MPFKKNRSAAVAALALLPLAATAQDDATPEDPFEGEASLNIVAARGNTETTTASAELDLLWDQPTHRERLSLLALNSQEDDETSAERYFVAGQVDFKLNTRSYVFVLGDYEADRFSGYEYRTNLAAGYGYRILSTDTTLLEVEFGPGVRYSKARDPEAQEGTEATLRAAVRHRWDFSGTASLRQELSTVAGEETAVSRYEAAVVADVIDSLALKVAYNVRHVSDTPPEVSSTDQTLTVGVVYGF